MLKLFTITIISVFLSIATTSAWAVQTYGQRFCNNPDYHCIKITRGQTWYSLFPNERERDVVQRLNRMNVQLVTGHTIAVPNRIRSTTVWDIAPFPHRISPQKTNIIKVDQKELAWGAYDTNGNLVNWGPMSGGQGYCADINRGCGTVSGEFTIYRRQGPNCISSRFPLPNGGAPMPYCMHFYRGYALHGSNFVPGHHASHGCVRLFVEDAKWLNLEFINLGRTRVLINRK